MKEYQLISPKFDIYTYQNGDIETIDLDLIGKDFILYNSLKNTMLNSIDLLKSDIVDLLNEMKNSHIDILNFYEIFTEVYQQWYMQYFLEDFTRIAYQLGMKNFSSKLFYREFENELNFNYVFEPITDSLRIYCEYANSLDEYEDMIKMNRTHFTGGGFGIGGAIKGATKAHLMNSAIDLFHEYVSNPRLERCTKNSLNKYAYSLVQEESLHNNILRTVYSQLYTSVYMFFFYLDDQEIINIHEFYDCAIDDDEEIIVDYKNFLNYAPNKNMETLYEKVINCIFDSPYNLEFYDLLLMNANSNTNLFNVQYLMKYLNIYDKHFESHVNKEKLEEFISNYNYSISFDELEEAISNLITLGIKTNTYLFDYVYRLEYKYLCEHCCTKSQFIKLEDIVKKACKEHTNQELWLTYLYPFTAHIMNESDEYSFDKFDEVSLKEYVKFSDKESTLGLTFLAQAVINICISCDSNTYEELKQILIDLNKQCTHSLRLKILLESFIYALSGKDFFTLLKNILEEYDEKLDFSKNTTTNIFKSILALAQFMTGDKISALSNILEASNWGMCPEEFFSCTVLGNLGKELQDGISFTNTNFYQLFELDYLEKMEIEQSVSIYDMIQSSALACFSRMTIMREELPIRHVSFNLFDLSPLNELYIDELLCKEEF